MAIRAKQIMRTKIKATVKTTVREAAHLLISSGLPGLPVVNDQTEVVGVITECNVLDAVREGKDLDRVAAGAVMTRNPVTAEVDASCRELIQIMLTGNHPIVPIVRGTKYAGVVSRHMIMDSTVAPDYTVIPARDQKEAAACA